MFSPACEPQTDKEWLAYYDLRWRILRSPWQQPRGSEKDEWDDNAVHRIIKDDNKVVAIGRLHFNNDHAAQIRYMAVAPKYEKQGLATAILKSLEQAAMDVHIHSIILDAREGALGFYKKQGYILIESSHILYDKIQHFRMKKRIII